MIAKVAAAILFLALNYYTYHHLARKAVIPPRTTFESFPLDIGEWHCPGKETLEPLVLQNLGATDYVICEYRRPEYAPVSLYVGYHATQVYEGEEGFGENSIHPPAHCLPGSGWDIIDSKNVPLEIPGYPQSGSPVKRLVIARGEVRHLVYYWYQQQGRAIADDWQKILFVGYDRARHSRTDGALVRFTIPMARSASEERAERSFRDFAERVLPTLHLYVPD
jgi:EpsI family protein